MRVFVYTLHNRSLEVQMPTVRDMIRRKGSEVYSVDPDATVYEALALMSKQNTGAVMVISGKNVDGILSERDCVRKVELLGKTARNTRVSEIMTSKVVYVEAGQQLEECMALMIDKNIRHLPVFDGKELLGLISVRDVLKEVVDVQKFMISQLEHYITGEGR
jgi:CBS domain-containing protein